MLRFDDFNYFNQVRNISFLANKFYSKQREKKEIALERMIRQVENGKATEKVKTNLASLIAKISLIDKAPHTITADVHKTEIDTDARKIILKNLNEAYLQLYNLTIEYLYISLQAMDEFFRLGLLKELNGFKKVLANKIQEEFNERKNQSVKKEKNAKQALKIVTLSVSRSFSQDGDYYISQSSPDFEARENISEQLNTLAHEMDLLINFKSMVSTKEKLTANDLKPFDGKELKTTKTLLDFSQACR